MLRTVWSVINRSPATLLYEILLIDDASNKEELAAPLEKYLKSLPIKIRLIRQKQRSGLIKARLLGASEAKVRDIAFNIINTIDKNYYRVKF